MRPILFALFLAASVHAADVLVAPSIAIDTSTTPPRITITLTIDGAAAISAQQTAVANTAAANAEALKRDPHAKQIDAAAAGRTAFVQALIPTLYRLVEQTQRGAAASDADLAAQAAAAKAKADADAAAATALRPVITTK